MCYLVDKALSNVTLAYLRGICFILPLTILAQGRCSQLMDDTCVIKGLSVAFRVFKLDRL